MTRLLTRTSDRLLTVLAPKAEATAACTYRCGVFQYRCRGIHLYRRACCINTACQSVNCSGWLYQGRGC